VEPVGRCRFSDDVRLTLLPALAEVLRSGVVVVAPAAQRDVVGRRLAAKGVRDDVVEFEEPACVAAMTVRSDVGAAAEVPHPDDALDRGRGFASHRVGATATARAVRVRELVPGQLLQQRGQRPIEDLRLVARGDRVAEHVRREPELLQGFAADGELELVAVRSER
jgi:hypothetical protein